MKCLPFIADSFTCQDHNNRQVAEGDQYFLVEAFTTGEASTAAVDTIFVADESGSIRAQDWIRSLVPRLERKLRDQGVGLGRRQNQYALVGFGRNNESAQGGIVLTQLTTPEGFINASRNLRLDGLFEDGYSGIEVALTQVQVRPDTARLLVLVTNEARSVLPGREGLTRSVMEQMIRNRGFILNVVVQQTFEVNSGESAFGLDSNRTAYLFNQSSPEQFFALPNGSISSDPSLGFPGTYEDYILLALNLGGAAWDIKAVIEPDSPFLPALTEAFVDVKVTEVMGVMRQCFSCLCIDPMRRCEPATSVTIENCQGPVPTPCKLLLCRVNI